MRVDGISEPGEVRAWTDTHDEKALRSRIELRGLTRKE